MTNPTRAAQIEKNPMKKKQTKSPRAQRSAQFVLVRTYSAGVHCGTLVSQDGQAVVLSDARRIWRWKGANTLHELSLRGAHLTETTRISEPVPTITLTQAIEVIPCAPEAVANLSQSRWLP